MSILNTHDHRLVFSIDNDAPDEYMDKWKDFNVKLVNLIQSTPGLNKLILE
tara:strand:- start:388 stop:540 length:153 start_codon:yes stop_codon:yes gene_type:complete